MRRYEPIYLTKYVHDNDLIENPGWNQLRCYVRKTNKMNRLIKSAKANQQRNIAEIKFGMKIYNKHK